VKPLLLTAAGLIAYTIFAKANALQRLTFYPGSVSGLRFDGVTPVVRVGILVQNTGNQQMQIRAFAGNVWANDQLIGNVSSYGTLTIPPRQQILYYTDLRLFPLGIVNNIVQAIRTGQKKQKIELDAMANVDLYQVPVKITYNIG